MPTGLLTTKLYVPRLRPELVSRPHLVERLMSGFKRRLTLLSAPAGFGKTTLLSECFSTNKMAVGWISLDEGDNDPALFWAYFIASLQTVRPDIGKTARQMLQSPQPPPVRTILTALINEIIDAGDSPDHPFIVVLDDYHVVEEQSIHQDLAFLIDHLPSQLHLVIATRSDPPLPLARLRAGGQLSEFRADDLRFTPGEAAVFLNEVMGLSLSHDDIAALDARTEGWIASLQMAALSMQGRKDVASFIAAFSGSHRYILDYLTEEVLNRQSASVQSFLLETSILEQLTGALCDAVTGREDGREMLVQLEAANLFLVPLDYERKWYRYHHLFAGLLRQRLYQMQAGRVQIVHLRASEWYEEQGLAAAAIDHALSAGELVRAAYLIEQNAETTLMRSEITTLLRWVDALPDDIVRARPHLCAFHAGALLWGGRPLEAVESRLREAAEGDTGGSVSGEVAVFRALIAAAQGNITLSTELSYRALELLSEESLLLRSIVSCSLGLVNILRGDVVAATRIFHEVSMIGQQTDNLMLTMLALNRLAQLRVLQGKLHEARQLYEQALEFAVDEQGRLLPISSLALIGIGGLEREWNDFEAATRHLTEGIELAKRWQEVGAIFGYVALALIEQAQGNADGAGAQIQRAKQLAISFDATDIDDIVVDAYQARLLIAQGDLEAAVRWVEERGLDNKISIDESDEYGSTSWSYYLRELEYVVLARLRIAQGRPDDALELLGPLQQSAEEMGRTGDVIEISVLQALALQARGDVEQAITLLKRALVLAEEEGYIRIFVDEGEPMERLLEMAASRGIAPKYVNKLRDAFSLEHARQRLEPRDASIESASASSALIESFTERELEVLRLVEAGLSNQEIADKLFLAVGTVKKHVYNIYGKLNVEKRTQAVARARELGLL